VPDQISAVYAERLPNLGNAEVDELVPRFCSECQDMRDWLKDDIGSLPGVTEADMPAHATSSPPLTVTSAVANSHKHRKAGTTTARIRSTRMTPRVHGFSSRSIGRRLGLEAWTHLTSPTTVSPAGGISSPVTESPNRDRAREGLRHRSASSAALLHWSIEARVRRLTFGQIAAAGSSKPAATRSRR
jgi:hypothetical protein